jgi:hypothetical protein
MYLWLALMLSLPHKEERFLFVIYPLICLAGAIALVIGSKVVLPFRKTRQLALMLTLVVLFVFVMFSLSRSCALILNYTAPMHIYKHLAHYELKEGKIARYPVSGNGKIFMSFNFKPSFQIFIANSSMIPSFALKITTKL